MRISFTWSLAALLALSACNVAGGNADEDGRTEQEDGDEDDD